MFYIYRTEKSPKPFFAQLFYRIRKKVVQSIGFSRFTKQSIMLSCPFYPKNLFWIKGRSILFGTFSNSQKVPFEESTNSLNILFYLWDFYMSQYNYIIACSLIRLVLAKISSLICFLSNTVEVL